MDRARVNMRWAPLRCGCQRAWPECVGSSRVARRVRVALLAPRSRVSTCDRSASTSSPPSANWRALRAQHKLLLALLACTRAVAFPCGRVSPPEERPQSRRCAGRCCTRLERSGCARGESTFARTARETSSASDASTPGPSRARTQGDSVSSPQALLQGVRRLRPASCSLPGTPHGHGSTETQAAERPLLRLPRLSRGSLSYQTCWSRGALDEVRERPVQDAPKQGRRRSRTPAGEESLGKRSEPPGACM